MEDASYLHAVRGALAPRYRIEREIGHGAFATVFLATDSTTDREVAVKVLKPEWSQAVARERFLREIRVTGQLHHANILALLDSGETEGFLFFVMPYVPGETLRRKLRRERQLRLDDVRRITLDVAAGLAAAHAQGVLHRDVKPENILLQDGRAMVADFGIAKAFTDAGVDTITSTGLGIGTPAYMSPEQASGEHRLDYRSDIYSLACVVYEMLAGETPHTGHSAQAIIAKKLGQPVQPLRVLRETISPALDAVMQRGLARLPADRYAAIEEFVAALEPALSQAPPERRGPVRAVAERTFRSNPARIVVGAALVVVAGVWASRYWRSNQDGWRGGRPQSVVVIPFHTATSSAQERSLSGELAGAITSELNHWESIRAVPDLSLAGPMFDLGLSGPTLGRESDGIKVARQVRVQALVEILVRVRGDSAEAEANLIDVERGHGVSRPFQTTARMGDMSALARPILNAILGLGAGNADPVELRRHSSFPDALVADMNGMQFLGRGRLSEAEQSFRRALAVDSSFALAKHHLAETLFWDTQINPGRLGTLAPQIAQLSTSAAAEAHGLLRRDSLQIAAFHAFQSGDYETSRAAYRELLQADPTDVHALLMRGTVESKDPWLVALPNGSYRPRANLNVAVRDVSEILRLQPTFDLGYSNLSDMYERVNEAAERGTCRGFEIPRNEIRLPWESGTPEQQRSFCLVVLHDSIAWLSKAEFDTFDRARARAGARRFFERYIALVRRWAMYAEHEVRPREEMVAALLAQRQRQGIAAPARLAAFADTALQFARSALALKSDTTADDLTRLGGLYLGIGDHASALRATEAALRVRAESGVAAPPLRVSAANAFIAAGQPLRAMEIVSGPRVQRFLRDTTTGALVPFGGAEPAIARIQVLGATGVGGDALRRELAEVQWLWTDSHYSEFQRRLLREAVTVSLATALMQDPAMLESWGRTVTVSDPLWRALASSARDPALSRRLLQTSMDTTSVTLSESTRSYLEGVVAARLNDHRLAIARFSRLDSIAPRLDNVDVGWGLRSLSELRRAESYEVLGDTANARVHYAAFRSVWAKADSLARPLVQEAVRGLARLEKSR